MTIPRLKLTIVVMAMVFTLNIAIAAPQSCNLHNHTQRLQKLKSSFSMHLMSENECFSFLKLTLLETSTNFILSIEGNAQAKKLIKANLGNVISIK